MKLIVETKGNAQVYIPGPDNHARHDRASVVNNSHVMTMKAASGELVVLAQVNDDATDVEFVNALEQAKGDKDLAIAAFVSEFPTEKEAEPEPEPEPEAEKPAKGAKQAEPKAAE